MFAPDDGQLVHFPFDLDFAFSQGVNARLAAGGDLNKFLSIPENEHAFYGHALDIITHVFNADYMNPLIDHLQTFAVESFDSQKEYIAARSSVILEQIETAFPQLPFGITSPPFMDVGTSPVARVEGRWLDRCSRNPACRKW